MPRSGGLVAGPNVATAGGAPLGQTGPHHERASFPDAEMP